MFERVFEKLVPSHENNTCFFHRHPQGAKWAFSKGTELLRPWCHVGDSRSGKRTAFDSLVFSFLLEVAVCVVTCDRKQDTPACTSIFLKAMRTAYRQSIAQIFHHCRQLPLVYHYKYVCSAGRPVLRLPGQLVPGRTSFLPPGRVAAGDGCDRISAVCIRHCGTAGHDPRRLRSHLEVPWGAAVQVLDFG